MSGGAVILGGQLDGQAALAQDASLQTVITKLAVLVNALNASTGAPTAGGEMMLVGGVDFNGKARPITLDGGGNVYIDGPFQGSIGSTVPGAAIQVAFKDVNGKLNAPSVDANGALALQSSGITGSPMPTKTHAVGGVDASGNLRNLAVDALGRLLTQAMGAAAVAAPSEVDQVGGVDPGGNLRPLSVTTAGAVSMQDASAVPEAPLSINGVLFTVNQAGAPPAPLSVGTSSTLLLPDSTGVGAINGVRGEVEIVNVGNVDVWVSPSLATVVGTVWAIRPGGSLVTTYSGPISAIQNGTQSGTTVGSPSPLVSVVEWA